MVATSRAWYYGSCTVEPRFYDMARGQQNHIVKSGYRCKRTPYLTIWRKSNQKYRCIGIWLTIK